MPLWLKTSMTQDGSLTAKALYRTKLTPTALNGASVHKCLACDSKADETSEAVKNAPRSPLIMQQRFSNPCSLLKSRL